MIVWKNVFCLGPVNVTINGEVTAREGDLINLYCAFDDSQGKVQKIVFLVDNVVVQSSLVSLNKALQFLFFLYFEQNYKFKLKCK